MLMSSTNDREIVMRVAWAYLGTPYVWGGDDPSGFDCSGFVIECLQSVGILPRKGDWTAQALFDMFQRGRLGGSARPMPGDLVFWTGLGGGKVIHVEIMVDEERSIGASGGGSATTSPAEAWKQNAYIKVRPIASRLLCAGVLNPFCIRKDLTVATKIYGASDDIIEAEGDVSAESCTPLADRQPALLACSDGTMIEVRNGKGPKAIWNLTVVRKGELFDRLEACEDEAAEICSDVVHFRDGLEWVVAANNWERMR